jgi:uncharacterized protein YndB with AHSA1/START domain
MNNPEFIYTTYIRTTPEKVWAAITNPEFTRQYWGGFANISDWKKGSKWQSLDSDEKRTVHITGEVLESDPPRRLVLSWADPTDLQDNSRVTFEIEAVEDMVRLNVVHGEFKAGSIMAGKVAWGWPRVLSSMKSFLETGQGLNVWAGSEHKCANSEGKEIAA